jgi:hypothetical protein
MFTSLIAHGSLSRHRHLTRDTSSYKYHIWSQIGSFRPCQCDRSVPYFRLYLWWRSSTPTRVQNGNQILGKVVSKTPDGWNCHVYEESLPAWDIYAKYRADPRPYRATGALPAVQCILLDSVVASGLVQEDIEWFCRYTTALRSQFIPLSKVLFPLSLHVVYVCTIFYLLSRYSS